MKRMNGLVLCIMLLAGTGIVTTISEDASAGFCDRFSDESGKCESGMSAASGLPGFIAAKAAIGAGDGARCKQAKADAKAQCNMKAGGSDPFKKGCEKAVKGLKCPDGGGGPECGNGMCESGEHFGNCPKDCPTCGNSKKDKGETWRNCPSDVKKPVKPDKDPCGDGTCDWENEDENLRETNTTCEKDCPCDQPWCQEECSGECTPTTCDEALEKVSTELETIKDELAEVKDDLVAVKDELAKPKVVKQTWISGIDNDMLIIYIMLTLILLFVAVPRIRKYLKDRKAKDGGPKSPTASKKEATPGVG